MKISSNFALFYGILLGDGCLFRYENARYICVTCDLHSDKPMFSKLLPIIEKIRGKPVKVRERTKEGKIEIQFSDKELFQKIANHGFPIGKKGTDLIISDQMLPFYKKIIQGYFATDGCLVITNNNGILYPRIEFSSISKKLLNQVNCFLIKEGINSKVYLSKTYQNSWNDLYRIQINGKKQLKLFKKVIGFFNPKHESRSKLFLK
ncbi:hypothetical protein HOC01_00185 [archaeon]|jgi:intein/homing endonuclease|nr:hypothetical protein [archaeon]MBT6698742.1 hypothetical protein [archaeon]